jgi:hypothetical protein
MEEATEVNSTITAMDVAFHRMMESNPALLRVDKETQKVSVIDVVRWVTGLTGKLASQCVSRLPYKLSSNFDRIRINGSGAITPVADVSILKEMIWHLPGQVANDFKRQSAQLTDRDIDEIQTRHEHAPTKNQDFLKINTERHATSPLSDDERRCADKLNLERLLAHKQPSPVSATPLEFIRLDEDCEVLTWLEKRYALVPQASDGIALRMVMHHVAIGVPASELERLIKAVFDERARLLNLDREEARQKADYVKRYDEANLLHLQMANVERLADVDVSKAKRLADAEVEKAERLAILETKREDQKALRGEKRRRNEHDRKVELRADKTKAVKMS